MEKTGHSTSFLFVNIILLDVLGAIHHIRVVAWGASKIYWVGRKGNYRFSCASLAFKWCTFDYNYTKFECICVLCVYEIIQTLLSWEWRWQIKQDLLALYMASFINSTVELIIRDTCIHGCTLFLIFHKNNNPLYSAEEIAPKPFTFWKSLRTLKFSSIPISAVNPEGPFVPLMMLSSLHPKHRCNLKIYRRHCEGLMP